MIINKLIDCRMSNLYLSFKVVELVDESSLLRLSNILTAESTARTMRREHSLAVRCIKSFYFLTLQHFNAV